jgi:FXSXX-COOH protein
MQTGDEGENETFSSEVIDLKDVDLSALGELPSAVLRSAIGRVCRELSGSAGAYASFQSSMRGMPLTAGGQVPLVNPDAVTSDDGNREQREKPGSSALSGNSGTAADGRYALDDTDVRMGEETLPWP